MNCSDISSRLVDFLYEEMPPSERAEFLAHLEGCASCGAEVKASSTALDRTRAALRGPLAEEPPARVHANVLAAARAAAANRRVEAVSVGTRSTRPAEREGFFSRLWKTPWFVPAMGAAGVAGLLFLVKVVGNPQILPTPVVTEEPGSRTKLLPQKVEEPDREPAPATAQQPARPPGRELAKQEAAGSGARLPAETRHVAAVRGKVLAKAPAPIGASAPSKKKLMDDPLSGIGREERVAAAPAADSSARWAAPPPPREAMAPKARKRGSFDDLLDEGPSGRQRGKLDNSEDVLAEGQARSHAPAGNVAVVPTPTRVATSPSGVRAPAPASPPAPAAVVVAASAHRASAPAEPASAAKQEKSAVRHERQSAEAEAPRPAPAAKLQAQSNKISPSATADKEQARADEKRGGENKRAAALQERVRKAEKLFAEEKWGEAAAAFRALIAEAPSNPSVQSWRERMMAAEQALKPAPAVKAKASNEALDGVER